MKEASADLNFVNEGQSSMEFWSRLIAVSVGFIHSFWGNNQPCNDVFLPVERA